MSDTFRKVYAPLTDEQKAEMEAIKTKAEELEALFNAQTPLPGVNGNKSRMLSLAKTNLEQSIMWAVKAVTE